MMRASQNSAVFRKDGKVIQIDGANLLASAEPFDAWQSLHLESLPNRDSLVYGEKYGIQNARTIFRGTLRYHGFSALLHVLKNMGLLDDIKTEGACVVFLFFVYVAGYCPCFVFVRLSSDF